MKKISKYSRVARVVDLLLVISFIILPISPVFAEEKITNIDIVSADKIDTTGVDLGVDKETKIDPLQEKIIEGEIIDPISTEEEITPIAPLVEEEVKEEEEEKLEEDLTKAPSATGNAFNSEPAKVILGEVDEHSGAFTYSYPFPLPPYRNMKPELSLDYNSQNKSKTSIAGYGFELSIPYIKRLNIEGTNNSMYDKKYFFSSLSGELTTSSSSGFGEYYSKTEDTFLKYTRNQDDSWSVKTKDGSTYTFGTTINSKQSNPNDSSKVLSWYLTSITDSNNNQISYTYFKDTNQVYLSEMNYGLYKVELAYQNSNDNKTIQYSSNYSIKSEKKLDKVEIFFNGISERLFNIVYTLPSKNRFSLISQIIDSSNSASPQVTEFNYEEGDSDFVRDSDWEMPYYMNNGVPTGYKLGSNSAFIDINNDGLLDFVTTDSAQFTSQYNDLTKTVFLNTGNGFERDSNWVMPYYTTSNGSYGLALGINSAFIDINSDGLLDFVYTGNTTFQSDGGSAYNDADKTVFKNTGSGFERDPNWDMPYNSQTGKGIKLGTNSTFADVNNDGLIDFISTGSTTTAFSNDGGSPYNDYDDTVFINTGTDFVRDPNWVMPYKNYQGIYQVILNTNSVFTDINNDGLIDFFNTNNANAFSNDGGSTYNDYDKTVYINNGVDGFYRNADWDMPYNTGTNKGLQLNANSTLTDLNNDGLLDFVYMTSGAFQSGGHNDPTKTVFINDGDDFIRDPNWDMPYSLSSGAGLPLDFFSMFADVNNDGLSDFIYSNTGSSNVFVNDGGSPFNDYDRTVYINTGTDFARDTEWDMPYYLNNGVATALNLNAYSTYTDVNNDGFTDFIVTCNMITYCNDIIFQSSSHNDPDQTVFLNTGIRDVMLTSIVTPYGGEVSITYKEKEMENFFLDRSSAPGSVTVVDTITYDDKVTPLSTTSYSYRNARYFLIQKLLIQVKDLLV